LTAEHQIFIWNAWGLFGLVPLVVCVAMAVFVYTTRPDRVQNRRLAVLLVTEGMITFGGPAGAAFAASDASGRVFYTVHMLGLFVVVPLILRFLATIDTPLARPLRTRTGATLPWVLAGLVLLLFVVRPTLFIRGLREPSWGGRMLDTGPLVPLAYGLPGLALIYSLIVALSSYRRSAPGTPARTRAGWYALAFGTNDGITIACSNIVPLIYTATHGIDMRAIEFMFVWSFSIAEVLFVLLMAYGILRTQLFDIDLRLAAGLRRGTIVAIVLFVFFVSAELAERFVSAEFGYVIGAVAAAVLLLVHKPVERFAEGFSRTVLPGVEASPEYVAFRKLQVYLEAVEAAYEDGQLSKEDRAILKRLQTTLGVAAKDAERLEDDARKSVVQSVG
jgi:hypothetical protein